MKYYSECCDKLFDTEDELLAAEANYTKDKNEVEEAKKEIITKLDTIDSAIKSSKETLDKLYAERDKLKTKYTELTNKSDTNTETYKELANDLIDFFNLFL